MLSLYDDPTTPAPVAPDDGAADGAAAARVGFIHDRTPPPEWVDQLREVSPLTDAHGVLALVWEPGDPWIPGQRWLLHELIAPDLIDFDVLRELKGPNPRVTGHMCTRVTVPGQFQCLCKVKLEGWRRDDGDPSGVTLTQWKLYRQTGQFGRPFWVIQGARGGHKHSLTAEEEQFLVAAGKHAAMPAIGDLPYADFDGRVLAHVVRFNRLRQLGGSVRAYRQRYGTGAGYRLHKAEVEQALRQQLVDWLDYQMADTSQGESVNELFLRAAKDREMDAHAPRTDIDYEKVGDASIHSYVQTGQFLHPSHVK